MKLLLMLILINIPLQVWLIQLHQMWWQLANVKTKVTILPQALLMLKSHGKAMLVNIESITKQCVVTHRVIV